MEEYIIYLKKFKIAVAIFLAAVALSVILVSKTVPTFKSIAEIQEKQREQKKELADVERRLADLKETIAKEKAEDDQSIKAFFKPMSYGADNETAISEEFEEILQILRENKIKTRSLKYDPEPQDDNFVKFAGDKYFVSKVTAEMIATYSNFENFLRDLYKHEHFLDISKIEIVPYQKNKRILLINLQIKLYAQKDSSSVSSTVSEVPASPNPSPKEQQQPKSSPKSADDTSPSDLGKDLFKD